jgi:hypothetical protein
MPGERSVVVGRLSDGNDQRRVEAVVAIREAMAAARRKRLAVVAGLLVLAASVTLALALPSPQADCPGEPGSGTCPTPYGLLQLRVVIVVIGLVIAVFLIWDACSSRRRRW